MDISIWQAIILGLVQGLGEFLPISSSAHLVLAPWFLQFTDPGLAFDAVLHLGTLFAVLTYFWKDWLEILGLAFGVKKDGNNYNKKSLWILVLATIPGALAGYFFESQAETIFRSPLVIAFTLSFVGLLLFLADKYAKHKKKLKEISWKESLVIGLAQALAIVPGVSRSGATITAGLFSGLSRISAAKFSFLLSTPIILGASLFKLPDLWKSGLGVSFWVGLLVSAVSGYLAIKYLLKFVKKASYKIFFWYRLILASLIILVYFLR